MGVKPFRELTEKDNPRIFFSNLCAVLLVILYLIVKDPIFSGIILSLLFIYIVYFFIKWGNEKAQHNERFEGKIKTRWRESNKLLRGKRGKRRETWENITTKLGMYDRKGRRVRFWFLVEVNGNDQEEADEYIPYYYTKKKKKKKRRNSKRSNKKKPWWIQDREIARRGEEVW